MTGHRTLGALVTLGAVLGLACGPVEGPHVVLVTLDTTRADHIGALGDSGARTPTLDALAERGAVFEQAFSSVPLTLPAHTSMLTGLGPNRHGVHDNGRFRLTEDLETVAERLAARGYDTGAFVSAFVLDASFGLDQGFDVYDDDVDDRHEPLTFAVASRRAAATTDRALEWLAQRGEAPFFLWVHYYDAHKPLDPPPPFDELRDPYTGEIAYMDSQLGRLLRGVEAAARGRERLVLAVGDHGEGLGEHGESTHGVVAYDGTLHVPLIAAGPGIEPGSRTRALARIEDIAPTILSAAGLAPDPSHGALALTELLAAGGAPDRISYFESLGPFYGMGWARLAGVRTERWKLTAEPDPAELYDVLEDPGETRNLATAEWEVATRLAEAYAEQRPDENVPPGEVTPEVEELLAQLGYVSAPMAADAEAPDPRVAVEGMAFVFAADQLAREGQVSGAIEALGILTQSPAVRSLALQHLGRILNHAGYSRRAAVVFQELVEATGSTTARVELASALLADERPEEALAALDALGDAPRARLTSVALGRARALLALGRADEAEAQVAAVLARQPDHDAALALRSRVRAERDGRPAETERLGEELAGAEEPAARQLERRGVLAELLRLEGQFEQARATLEVGTPPPAHQLALARIAAAAGDLPRAIELQEELTGRFPSMLAARRDLGDLYGRAGRLEDQLAVYDALIDLDPRDAGLLIDRGVALSRAERSEAALRDFRAAAIVDAELPEAAFNVGLLQLQAGQTDEAERNLHRAVELRPDYAKAHFHLARLYRQRGDPRAGLHAERAAELSPAVSSGPPAP